MRRIQKLIAVVAVFAGMASITACSALEDVGDRFDPQELFGSRRARASRPVATRPPAPTVAPESAEPEEHAAPPAPAAQPEEGRAPVARVAAKAGEPTEEDRRTFDLVNEMRRGRGLRPFRWNDRLFRAAYDHSAEQARYGYMGHGSPDPSRDDLADRLRLASYGQARQWAEVVAWGYEGPASVVQGWMDSRGHRKILTDPNLEEAAFSRVGSYFTGDFGSPVSRSSPSAGRSSSAAGR